MLIIDLEIEDMTILQEGTILNLQEGAGLPVLMVPALALIDRDGRVLLSQRPKHKDFADLWEFPGGKIEAGETPETALIREIREELAVDIEASCLAPLSFASHAYEAFHLVLLLYICRQWHGHPAHQEGGALAWVLPNDLRIYAMPPANQGFISVLQDMLAG